MGRPPLPILYVHHRPELGGAPMSLRYLIEALDRDRFEPHVFCPRGPVMGLFAQSGAVVHVGTVSTFTHIWASTYRGRRWALLTREGGMLPRHLVEFDRVLRRHRFALVHLNDSPLIPAAIVARRRRLPIVWHLRAALPEGGRDIRSLAIRAAIRRLAAASIAINQDVAESFAVGSLIVPNAVDLDRFWPADPAAAKESLGIDPNRAVVAYFGFIYPSKGFRDFIYGASLARAQGLDAVYLIVGGPVRGEEFFATRFGRSMEAMGLAADFQREAEDLVARLGLEDCVRFVGFTDDTAQLYQASDVVVAPSRGPELGRPVLEAAACGRPVVSSGSLDGAGVLLPGVTGELVPQRSPAVLAAVLGRLISDPALRRRLGENARRHAEQHFAGLGSAETVMEVYDRVVKRAR
jgi:glycosyltransferase involved in cell wall biosynthesis